MLNKLTNDAYSEEYTQIHPFISFLSEKRFIFVLLEKSNHETKHV